MIRKYFLHIPKTAGSTLREVFRRNHLEHFELIPGSTPYEGLIKAREKSDWENKELIWLHGDWDCCEEGAPVFTMLREPIARLESYYFYVKSQPTHYLHDFCCNTDFITFIEKADTLEMNNGHCRILAGFGGYHGMHSSKGVVNNDSELLTMARENLFSHVAAFGLQSRFVDSLMVFEDKLNWSKGINFKSINQRTSDFKVSRLSEKEIDCIKAFNKEDIELYAEALELFESRFNEIKNPIRNLKYKILKR